LSQNDAYRFTSDDNISFLSFFQNKKYKVESRETEPASVSAALKEFGIHPVETGYEPPSVQDISIKTGVPPKIIFREVSKKDTANYQLFQPENAMNGLQNFFEFIMSCIEKGEVKSYQNNPDGEFISELNLADIKRITKTQGDTITAQNVETGTEYQRVITSEKPVINKYLIKELHIGPHIFILGACPVQEYYASNDYDKQNPTFINTFWLPFSKTFRQEQAKQEICRMNCEPERTFCEYFAKNKYSGKIIKEKSLTDPEAEMLIKELNK
jgi:hypothetical protein